MGPGSSDDITRSVTPNSSDPREIARQFRGDPPDPDKLPDRIGPYKILALLGDGGMGIVYLGERTAPSLRAAVKIIRPLRATKEILARFEIEREALALMDHPNIAKVFDAGESDDGRPYFVMEYVHGIAITEYCDKSKLTTNERLELFVDVCHAVHHAHQKGIIHRDIKPSNVLVAIQENRPIVKVIDFGVAKAIGHQLTQRTIFTEQGQLIGTPGYMSPEQAEMSALNIDTRTDIYSLGVLLYELLVGAQPFDTHKLLAAGFGEMQRIIREVDPPMPSTRFSSLGEDSTAIAHNRNTAVRTLTRELRDDLDWIAMKCLEKDRIRRYEVLSALADDVQRHLRAEPVEAGPPGALYRIRKFTRRHRYGVAAGLGIAIALIAGFVTTTVEYFRADREWMRAEEKAATATEVTDFMIGLFKVSDPSESLGNSITARDILERGERRIRLELETQPLVQAAMLDTIGSVYSNLGLYREAEELLREAVEIRKRELLTPHYDTATSLHHWGVVLDRMGKYEDAERCHKEGLAICQRAYGREHIATSGSLIYLADTAYHLGRRDEAFALRNEALTSRRKQLPSDDVRLADALKWVGHDEYSRSETEPAKQKVEQAFEIYSSQLGGGHPKTVECAFLLADIAFATRDFTRADRLYAEALSSFESIYGKDDTHVARCLNVYGNFMSTQGKFDQAESMARRALSISINRLGPEHSQVASDYNFLGSVCRDKGNYEEALEYHHKSLEIRLKIFGKDDEFVGLTRGSLGVCLMHMKRFDESESELLEAMRIYNALWSKEDHHRKQKLKIRLFDLYNAWEKPEKAKEYAPTSERT